MTLKELIKMIELDLMLAEKAYTQGLAQLQVMNYVSDARNRIRDHKKLIESES